MLGLCLYFRFLFSDGDRTCSIEIPWSSKTGETGCFTCEKAKSKWRSVLLVELSISLFSSQCRAFSYDIMNGRHVCLLLTAELLITFYCFCTPTWLTCSLPFVNLGFE